MPARLGEKDACNGDSGGPLAVDINSTATRIGFAFVNQESTTDVELSNFGGDATAMISDLALESEAGVSIKEETCTSAALAPGGSCTVTLAWSPTDVGNIATALLATSSDGGQTRALRVRVAGTALQPAELADTLDSPELQFHVDGRVDWEVVSLESATGGAALQTSALANIPGPTALAVRLDTPGTLSFDYRGPNTGGAVLVGSRVVQQLEGERETRLPCSQSCTVHVLTPVRPAKASSDTDGYSRICRGGDGAINSLVTSVFSPTDLYSYSCLSRLPSRISFPIASPYPWAYTRAYAETSRLPTG